MRMEGGREKKEKYEQHEASLQYKILNISKGTSAAVFRVLLVQAFLETVLLEYYYYLQPYIHQGLDRHLCLM